MTSNKKNNRGTPPRKSKKKDRGVPRCPVCGASIQMVPATEMNFRFVPPKPDAMYWRCTNYPHCDTYIIADERTKQPSGLLAGPALRHKRMCIHHWEKMFGDEDVMDKNSFRQLCASQIGYFKQGMVHTRNMTEFECDAILAYLQKLYENQPRIHDMVDIRNNSSMWKQVRGLNTGPNHGVYYNEDGTIEKVIAD